MQPFPQPVESAYAGQGTQLSLGMGEWPAGAEGRHGFLVACMVAGQLSKRKPDPAWPSQRPSAQGYFQETGGIPCVYHVSPRPHSLSIMANITLQIRRGKWLKSTQPQFLGFPHEKGLLPSPPLTPSSTMPGGLCHCLQVHLPHSQEGGISGHCDVSLRWNMSILACFPSEKEAIHDSDSGRQMADRIHAGQTHTAPVETRRGINIKHPALTNRWSTSSPPCAVAALSPASPCMGARLPSIMISTATLWQALHIFHLYFAYVLSPC